MPFVNPVRNPFHRVQCPFCFEGYYPGECAIWSSVNNKELVEAPRQVWKRAWRRVVPIRLSGKKQFVYELAQRKCPYCGELLPNNIDEPQVENYIIAIVGAGASGKSHYIAAAIKELLEQQRLMGYAELTADGTTQKEYLDHYYGPLFREGRNIPLTPETYDPTRKPLVFRMTLPVAGPEQAVRTINLFFYDAAGEQIVNENQAVRYSRYLLHASAIILLADPQKMDGIVRQLPFHLRPAPPGPNDPQPGVDKAINVLNNVLGPIRRLKGLLPGTPLSLPIAITLSKSDILKSLAGLQNQPHFLRKAPGYYDKMALFNDLRVVNDEVSYFLEKFGDEPLLYVPQRAKPVGYFAISATGHPKQPDGTYPAVEPVRCLDPLLWVFRELGILAV